MMRGVNDLHIAGHARSLALTLVSNNIKKIISVEGLGKEPLTGEYPLVSSEYQHYPSGAIGLPILHS